MKHLLRVLLLLLIRLLGLPAARKATRKTIATPVRILLIRPDHLGDMVLTTPVLNALKTHAPGAQVTLMVGSWSSEIVARHPALDRLITCPFPGFRRDKQGVLEPYIQLFRIAQQLQRGNYDLAINLRPDFWWGSALMYLAAIPHRVGYALRPGTPFLTQAELFHTPEHATISSLRLVNTGLRILGVANLGEQFIPERYPLVFVPTEAEQGWAKQHLHDTGIEDETQVAIIHAGTGAAVKLWRVEAWARTADTLRTKFGMQIVLTGSPNERSMLEEIAQNMTTPPVLVTDATVGQLAALLKRASLVLGVDNGPLHLAVAQETLTLQIFGPTDTHIFGPWGPAQRHAVVASTHRCPTCPFIPCGRLDFRPEELPAHPCVRLVTEEQVQESYTKLLQQQSFITNDIENEIV